MLYTWNQHGNVYQLYFNFKTEREKEKKHTTLFKVFIQLLRNVNVVKMSKTIPWNIILFLTHLNKPKALFKVYKFAYTDISAQFLQE